VLQQDLTRAEALLALGLGPDAHPQTAGQRLVCCIRAELALARKEPALALAITDRLIASTANLTEERVIPRLWKLRGEALAALDRETEAEAALQAAQVTAQTRGLRPLLWRICLALGLLYQRQAQEVAAEQAFSTAQAMVEQLAASVPDERVRQQFLSQTAHLLPQRRLPTPGRTGRQSSGGLTEREREVAVLIAQHLSNREIADLLVISERTVESHVSNIMFKLGLTSRKQIAAWTVENGLRANH
jgi:DNA-binding CsgD family transcriptional regulator